MFLYASPLVVGLLLHAAYREVRRPALALDRQRAKAAGPNAGIAAQLRELEPGPARDLLAEVVRLTRAVLRREPEGPGRERLQDELRPIGEAAAGVAAELDGLDRTLARLREGGGQGHLPASWWAAVVETERSRDRIAQSLLELIATLGRLQASPRLAGPEAGETLGELTSELARDLERHQAARAEVAAIGAGRRGLTSPAWPSSPL